MCFKNLPIEFDANGKASLREGVNDPYSFTATKPKSYVRKQDGPAPKSPLRRKLRDWSIDPVTRVAGALAVHTALDLEEPQGGRRLLPGHDVPWLRDHPPGP